METLAAFYGGEYFRTEREARWAVFFDALRLRWRYDRGGFSASAGGWVSPAFWLPELDRWVIVAPWPHRVRRESAPYDQSIWRRGGPSGLNGRQIQRMVVLYGLPVPQQEYLEEFGPECAREPGLAALFSYAGINARGDRYLWAECPRCHRVGLVRGGEPARLCTCFPSNAMIHPHGSRRLERAFARAAEVDISTRRMSQGLLTPEYRRHCMPN